MGDGLFGVFAGAFWILTAERVVLQASKGRDEIQPYVYVLRFCAFLLILVGFYLKNRKKKP